MKKARERLKRKNIYLDEGKLKELREILNVNTNSEALREATEIVVSGKKISEAFERLRIRGTWGR
ncbi:MAG: hypothetical protein L0Y68_01690 [Candidatus Dadabacteria bacterium]|nr:hypothetical protein [Candidatus Dadabacteria bacterium]